MGVNDACVVFPFPPFPPFAPFAPPFAHPLVRVFLWFKQHVAQYTAVLGHLGMAVGKLTQTGCGRRRTGGDTGRRREYTAARILERPNTSRRHQQEE